ncbi:hypothetical protein L7F22_008259 [Adiantum nelumboides]|nr:hypothetical protein [Adiantum nelumboides]
MLWRSKFEIRFINIMCLTIVKFQNYGQQVVEAANYIGQGFVITLDNSNCLPIVVQYPYKKNLPSKCFCGRIRFLVCLTVLFSVTGFGFDLANWFRISGLRQLDCIPDLWLDNLRTDSGSGLSLVSFRTGVNFCNWLVSGLVSSVILYWFWLVSGQDWLLVSAGSGLWLVSSGQCRLVSGSGLVTGQCSHGNRELEQSIHGYARLKLYLLVTGTSASKHKRQLTREMGCVNMLSVDSACYSHSPSPRPFSSFLGQSILCHGFPRAYLPFIDQDCALSEKCFRYLRRLAQNPSIDERNQLCRPIWPLSTSYQGHVCRCLGKDDMVTDLKSSGLGRDTEEGLLHSFKQMLSMDANGFFYGTDDDDEDVAALKDMTLLRAIVKVYCVSAEPDYSLPWQLRRQVTTTGSGFMIAGKKLITNAHCVEHQTQVTVKRTGDDTKYIANVLAIGADCDLALLSVQDEEFWKDAKPLEFGSLPALQDGVTVIGYPVGGTTVSVTKGVVSRIEVTSYAHGDSELLAVQIDAAINPGNSGGPAFNDDGECVGIAFQAHDSADNIGYVIPTPVIHHFLKDYNKHGHYTGFPSLGLVFQTLTNPDLRKFLQMTSEQKEDRLTIWAEEMVSGICRGFSVPWGILVQKVEPLSPSNAVLKEGDVIFSLDGIPISNEATVPLRPGERIALSFLVSQKFTGDKVVIGVLRDGKEMEVTTTLRPSSLLVPVHIRSKHPTYLIIAGLVFTTVTEPLLLESYSEENIYVQMRLRASAGFNMAEFEGQEMVLLSQVLAHSVNIGYEDLGHLQALRFNGTKIQNMQHLAQLVDSCESPYMKFELEHRILVVLATDSARASTATILKDYCIAEDRSQDLRAVRQGSFPNGAPSC